MNKEIKEKERYSNFAEGFCLKNINKIIKEIYKKRKETIKKDYKYYENLDILINKLFAYSFKLIKSNQFNLLNNQIKEDNDNWEMSDVQYSERFKTDNQ